MTAGKNKARPSGATLGRAMEPGRAENLASNSKTILAQKILTVNLGRRERWVVNRWPSAECLQNPLLIPAAFSVCRQPIRILIMPGGGDGEWGMDL